MLLHIGKFAGSTDVAWYASFVISLNIICNVLCICKWHRIVLLSELTRTYVDMSNDTLPQEALTFPLHRPCQHCRWSFWAYGLRLLENNLGVKLRSNIHSKAKFPWISDFLRPQIFTANCDTARARNFWSIMASQFTVKKNRSRIHDHSHMCCALVTFLTLTNTNRTNKN